MPDKKQFSKKITGRFLEAVDTIISNRKNGRITLNIIGDIIGMSASNIARLRTSENNIVTVEAIGRLCKHYNISPAWIILGKGEMMQGIPSTTDQRLSNIEKEVKMLNRKINDSQVTKKVTKFSKKVEKSEK